MTTLNDLYSEANDAKRKGDFDKATQLYKSVIEQYPNAEEADYAAINIDEMVINRDECTSQNRLQGKPSEIILSIMFYGFIGAISGIIITIYLIIVDTSEGYAILSIIFTLPFGLIVGLIIGGILDGNPNKNKLLNKIFKI